jgi:hypothetical protein
VVPRELLEALAAEAPGPESPKSPPVPPTAASHAGNGPYTSRLLVDRWLSDREVSFRIKPEPDAKGRAVYVLAQCPFDPAHTDPDACIMQEANGKLSAQCFHNSCCGRGWQAFKQAIGPPDPHHYDPPLPGPRRPARKAKPRPTPPRNGHAQAVGPTGSLALVDGPGICAPPGDEPPAPGGQAGPPGLPHLPEIQVNDRQLCELTDEAMQAVLAANTPPRLFQRGGLLVRLRVDPDSGAPTLEPLLEAALRGHLARVARYVRIDQTENDTRVTNVSPPLDLVRDVGSLPTWDGLPPLTAVAETPVFSAAGDLVQAPGYHPQARLWLHLSDRLTVPEVPPWPTREDIDRAKALLFVDLFGDFPFADDASKATALAALLLAFVRQLIDGPTPLHLLDAPVEGTGKTLLASCISEVSTGRPVEAVAEASDDEEWRKRLTAVLLEGPALVLLDNLNRVLDSGALAAVLTARVWKDRVLGASKTARLPNLAVWLASGNNTRLSREVIRRTVWCRLDAGTDAPWERKEFRHANLLGWAKAHRGELVWAALVLCQAWVAAGRPAGTQTLGMFESWAETMGGILDVAGVPGLLANAQTFRQQATDKVSEWRAFVAAWWAKFGGQGVGVKDLFNLACGEQLLDSVLGDKGEKSQRIRLGLALARARDRVLGEFRIRGAEEDHSHRQVYRLEPAGPQTPPAPAPGADTFELSG